VPLGISKYQPPPHECSRPHFTSILGVYIVVGCAPNLHAIKKLWFRFETFTWPNHKPHVPMGKKNHK
jgi:hypothetical protein